MSISYLKNGEAYTAENLNRPIRQLESQISEIQTQLGQITGRSYIVTENLPIDPSNPPAVGNLVYMGDDGKVRPALAVWNPEADQGGIITPAPSAYVYGMVVEQNLSEGTVNVMTGGSVERTSEIASGLGEGGTPIDRNGLWYLSDVLPGKVRKASSGKPYLRIPVISVSSSFVSLTGAVPACGYHIHKAFTIGPTVNWNLSDGVYTYSGTSIDDLIFFNWKDATFLVDGVEDYEGAFSLDEDNGRVVVKSTVNPNNKTVQIYTAVPDSHEQPVVRGIRTVGSGRLHASSENGLVTIGVDTWDVQEPTPGYRDRAISKLTSDGNYEMTKVVSSLVSDSTLTVREGQDGQWILSSIGGPLLRPVTTSLENATITTSNGVLYYVFPRSRASAVLGSINIPKPPDGWRWTAFPFVTAAYGSVNLSATMMFSPDLDFGETGNAPSSMDGSLPIAVSTQTGVVSGKSGNGWAITSGGIAWLRLASSGSSVSDMNILSFGLWLEIEEA